LLFIYFKNKKLIKSSSEIIKSDIKYQFLYKLSFYSVLFIPIGLFVQIFVHRYILASLVIWVSFIFYSLKYEESLLKRIRSISIFLSLVIVSFLYIYILPTYLFGTSGMELPLVLFMSNSTLFFLFL